MRFNSPPLVPPLLQSGKKMTTPERRKVKGIIKHKASLKKQSLPMPVSAPPQPPAQQLSPESSVIPSQDLSRQLQAILARSRGALHSVYDSPPRLTASTKASLPNAEGLLSEADLMKFQKRIALMKERIKQGLGSLGETPIKGPDVPTQVENHSHTETQPSLDTLPPLQHQHRDQRCIHGAHSEPSHSGSNGSSSSVNTSSPELPSVSSSALDQVPSPRSGGTRVLEPFHSTGYGSDVGPVDTRALSQSQPQRHIEGQKQPGGEQKRRALVSRIADQRCADGPGMAVSQESQHLNQPAQLDRESQHLNQPAQLDRCHFEPQIDAKFQHQTSPSRWNTFVLALLGLAPVSSLVPTPTATATETTPLRLATAPARGSTLPQAQLQSSTRRPLLRLVLALYTLALMFMLRITICSLLRSPLEAALVSGRSTEAVDLINTGWTAVHDDSTHLGWGMTLQRIVCGSCKGDHPMYLALQSGNLAMISKLTDFYVHHDPASFQALTKKARAGPTWHTPLHLLAALTVRLNEHNNAESASTTMPLPQHNRSALIGLMLQAYNAFTVDEGVGNGHGPDAAVVHPHFSAHSLVTWLSYPYCHPIHSSWLLCRWGLLRNVLLAPTALHVAAANGDAELVLSLTRAGADPLAADFWGNIPAHIAAINGHSTVLSLLLEAAALACEAAECENLTEEGECDGGLQEARGWWHQHQSTIDPHLLHPLPPLSSCYARGLHVPNALGATPYHLLRHSNMELQRERATSENKAVGTVYLTTPRDLPRAEAAVLGAELAPNGALFWRQVVREWAKPWLGKANAE